VKVPFERHGVTVTVLLATVALFGTACATSSLPASSAAASGATSAPAAAPAALPVASPPAKFPQARLARQGDRFQFLLDEQPLKLVGINYNVDYSELPVSRQAARHNQDLSLLSAHGFKIVTGWGIFNETTLEAADRYDVKVVMPIELDPTKVYGNPSFRKDAIDKLVSTVARYQNFPALIMWNPGGDEFLAYLEVDLQNRSVRENRQKKILQDASNLLVEMAQLAYRNDKFHRPSVIKHVQDWHVAYFGQSLDRMRQSGDDPSSYIVYGADVYGWPDYIAPILTRVEAAIQRLGLAWFVTEFGPVGAGPSTRASAFLDAFRLINQTSSMGAAVYVFAPDLPEPLLAAPLSLLEIHDDPVDDFKRQLVPVDSTLQDLGDAFQQAQQENLKESGRR
jgi:hypothetical protein